MLEEGREIRLREFWKPSTREKESGSADSQQLPHLRKTNNFCTLDMSAIEAADG
jgi:hypothetical protein